MKNSKHTKGSTMPKNAPSTMKGADYSVRQNDAKARSNASKMTMKK